MLIVYCFKDEIDRFSFDKNYFLAYTYIYTSKNYQIIRETV